MFHLPIYVNQISLSKKMNENKWHALMNEKGDRPLTWEDIPEDDKYRFGMENSGRCYAANYPLDRILAPLRRVYYEYRDKAEKEAREKNPDGWCSFYWNGNVSDPKWGSSVMLSELQAIQKELDDEREKELEE